jgi:hypothetical protein
MPQEEWIARAMDGSTGNERMQFPEKRIYLIFNMTADAQVLIILLKNVLCD